MLEPHVREAIARFLQGFIVGADFRIGSTNYPAKIRRALVSGDTIRVHVYLTDQAPTGTVNRVRLFDAEGKVAAQRLDPHVHEAGKGLMFEFRWRITEEVQ